nr:hypothetical protein [Acinetobacter sp. Marseille-Q1620]
MNKNIKLTVTALLAGIVICSTPQALADKNKLIQGYWAMIPLNNGIANVAYFGENGDATLYPFLCDFKSRTFSSPEQPEISKYEVKNNTIYLFYKDIDDNQKLAIKKLDQKHLVLEQLHTPQFSSTFEYQRVDRIKSLCPTD